MIKQIEKADAYHATIHMAGDYDDARRVCRKFVMCGACVQLAACEYIYTAGMESGFTVRIMNYAKFPRSEDEIENLALQLACQLCRELCQKSFSIETPRASKYFVDSDFIGQHTQGGKS